MKQAFLAVLTMLMAAPGCAMFDRTPRETARTWQSRHEVRVAALAHRAAGVYVAIGPRAAADGLRPLLDHRAAQGYSVRFLAIDDLPLAGDVCAAAVAALRNMNPPPAYILLVGDALSLSSHDIFSYSHRWNLPAFEYFLARDVRPDRSDFRVSRSNVLATDVPFGDFDADGLPDAAVGRFPVRTPRELEAMVDKTLRYERETPGGQWQRRAVFIAGEGGFGPVYDAMIEQKFADIVEATVPYDFNVEVAYAHPRSAYHWPAEEFASHVADMLSQGCLFAVYAGHGSCERFDTIWVGKNHYEIMESQAAARLNTRAGPPIMIVLACDCGQFTNPYADCVAEALARSPKGPVAVLAASMISSPYGNAVLGYELSKALFDEKRRTLGQAINAARRRLLQPPDGPIRRDLEQWAEPGRSTGLGARADLALHSRMYVLFGDPALRVRLPVADIQLQVPATTHAGDAITMGGTLARPATNVSITVETARTVVPRAAWPTDSRDPRTRWHDANDKVIARGSVTMNGRSFIASLAIPESLRPGQYWLRAFADTAPDATVGAWPIEIDSTRRR